MTRNWIVDGALLVSFAIAIAWIILNPIIIIVGYYLRDKTHDEHAGASSVREPDAGGR